MKKITRKNLDELMVSMPIISEIQQKTYIGGGDGSPNNPYTVEQYDFLCSIGVWQGGYVEGWGYTSPEVIINGGNSGSWGGDSGYNPGYWGDGNSGNNGGYWDSGNNTGLNTDDVIALGNYVNCIEARLKTDLLAFFGLNAFDIDIAYGTNLSAKGRVVDGKIELGTNLLKEYGYNDILSVVLHEVLHIKNDDNSWNNTPHKLSQTFVLENIPSEFNNFILNYAESFQTTSGAEWIYMDEITYNYINDPIYYKNEIKAYSQEIQMNSNVSKEYDIERKYMLWKSQRLYDIALANYNK